MKLLLFADTPISARPCAEVGEPDGAPAAPRD